MRRCQVPIAAAAARSITVAQCNSLVTALTAIAWRHRATSGAGAAALGAQAEVMSALPPAGVAVVGERGT